MKPRTLVAKRAMRKSDSRHEEGERRRAEADVRLKVIMKSLD